MNICCCFKKVHFTSSSRVLCLLVSALVCFHSTLHDHRRSLLLEECVHAGEGDTRGIGDPGEKPALCAPDMRSRGARPKLSRASSAGPGASPGPSQPCLPKGSEGQRARGRAVRGGAEQQGSSQWAQPWAPAQGLLTRRKRGLGGLCPQTAQDHHLLLVPTPTPTLVRTP